MGHQAYVALVGRGQCLQPTLHLVMVGAQTAPRPWHKAQVAQAFLCQALEKPDLPHPNLVKGGQGELGEGGSWVEGEEDNMDCINVDGFLFADEEVGGDVLSKEDHVLEVNRVTALDGKSGSLKLSLVVSCTNLDSK